MRTAQSSSLNVVAAARPQARAPSGDPYLHRIIGQPVEVRVEGGQPVGFLWRDRNYRIVEVLVSPPWWRRRRHYVVRAHTGEVLKLAREGASWLLLEELYPVPPE